MDLRTIRCGFGDFGFDGHEKARRARLADKLRSGLPAVIAGGVSR